jgi:hypothetical protein
MYMNLNGDLGYHLLNDERDKLNVYFSHRSMNGELEYVDLKIKQKAIFNDNLGGIEYKHLFNPSILRIGANYGYSMFNYYGFPFGLYKPQASLSSFMIPFNDLMKNILDSDSLSDRQTNQVNQTINAYAGIQSKEYTRIGYMLDFDFVRFIQKYGLAKEAPSFNVNTDGIRENKYTLRLGLNSRFGDGNRLAGLAGKLNYFEYDYPGYYSFYPVDSFGYKNYMELTVTPYIRFEGDVWKAQLGVNLMMITGDSTKYFISPNITVEAQVADKTVFYVNALGEIQSNDPYELSKRNRYMDFSVLTKPSRTWLDATLGIRTGIVSDLWLDFFAGYRITENEVFFVPSMMRGPFPNPFSSLAAHTVPAFSSFYTAYQPDASLFRVGATLKYKYMNKFDFSVKGVYNQWSFSAGDGMGDGNYDWVKPYGRPAVEVNADLTVKPLQPLALTLGYYLGADRSTLLSGNRQVDLDIFSPFAETIQMQDIHDLNVTASWNFNKTVGAYLKLNNLLFQKQELYYGYPMQGFNAMVGVNLNF